MKRLAGFQSTQKRLYVPYKLPISGFEYNHYIKSLARLGGRSHKRKEAFKSFLAKMEAKKNV